ncbi:MAG: 16S rRNA processing protein RimM [Bacteroidales bacterium]|nr:16S rRNA processing protein RimM [Candidatus Physcousia equi]
MIHEEEVYKIGTLTRVHALRGELNFSFTDDVWDDVFGGDDVESAYLILRVDGILVPFFLEEWRFRSDSVALVKFEGVDQADDAAELAGSEVFFPKALTPETTEDELRWTHFVGYELRMKDGRTLGKIGEVDEGTANVLFYVQTPQGDELIVPANEELVHNLSQTERWIEMDIPEGLIELNN